ncbi:T9SS_type A sorting domain-containing protein [Hexamita inflata]|uniref:T9SS type A sorting domain-containing protein n=1 Tax=Hexamita inflata TaxID=28002 RepID=A0AA86R067_9EUKA|nr:T9SS type A sorting domain-containing protein [Hexamita inflata]
MPTQNIYDCAMAVKYMDKVIDGVLKIRNDPELTSLDFLQTVGEIFCDDDLGMNIVDFENFGLEQNYGLAITKLELENCCNIIPKLNNRNIKELILNNCNVQNIDQLQLDGLVKLCLQQGQGSKCNSKLIYNMTKFNMLTQLSLNGYNDVDISPLSQMIQLNVLSLKSCGLRYVDFLEYLINLKELDISHNNNLDITPLQYIPQITKFFFDIKPHSASVVIPHCLFQFTKLQGSFFCDDWQGHRLLSQSGILLVLSDLQLFRQLCISSFVSWLCVY